MTLVHTFSEAHRRDEAHDRRIANETRYRWWEDPPNFEALDALIRDNDAASILLQGLVRHYPKAISEGRLRLWAKAAHSIIDLLAEPFADEHRTGETSQR